MNSANRTRFTRFSAALVLFVVSAAVSAGANAASTSTLADPALPAMLRLAWIQSRAGEAGSAYHIDDNGRGANPRHGLGLAFTPAGARIDGGEGGFALRLERFGRGDGRPVRRAVPRIDGAWIEYDRGAGLREWFVNLPDGVEQGWTVTERPAGGGALVLELDTGRPPDEEGNGPLAWSGLVHHRLVAFDADGRRLPADWTQDGTRLRIEVDDSDAAYPLLIDPWVQQAKLTADDGATEDNLGTSVALAGDTALVGAYLSDVGGNDDQGAAYVFIRSGGTWSEQAKLVANDGATDDEFGTSVALASDTAVVGARLSDVGGNDDQGTAYVFTRSGEDWSQQAKFTAEDGAGDDQFGVSVALAGDTALVGAHFVDVDSNSAQGAAYVFTRSGEDWSQQAKLTVDDGAGGDKLGTSVALTGDTALVGAEGVNMGGNFDQGAAYVFTRNGDIWSPQAKFTAEDGMGDDNFGNSVALEGDTALVGARFANVGGTMDQGAAYVFTRSGNLWSQQAKLVAEDGGAFREFGDSVALAGDTALVGAPGNFFPGAAYIFTRSGEAWSQQAKLIPDDGIGDDRFGDAVALAGDTALVGAENATVNGNDEQGATYVFRPELSFAPVALAVDPPGLTPEANGVFEPGEAVDVAPTWRNDGDLAASLAGTASSFTGPAGATYSIDLDAADYGLIEPAATADCLDNEVCYRLALDDPAARPATHWDTTCDETLDDLDGIVKPWTLHIGDSFTDVARASLFYVAVETLLHHGVSGDPSVALLQLRLLGCAETEFCPAAASSRAEAAVFLLKGLEGGGFDPPDCVSDDELFDDVPAEDPFCPWIEEFAARGVTAGCGGGNYCPDSPVTRAQMAVLLLKTAQGPDYEPPVCNGVFGDVTCPSQFADWIEDLFVRGVTAGCGGGNFCPADPITRGQMATFVANTFGLVLYGP